MSTTCTPCPAGSSCGDPTVGPVTCPDGHYSAAKATGCTPCPGGAPCSATGGVGTACVAGEYIAPLTYATECNECTAGHFCPHTKGGELDCPTGTYSNVKATTCTLCEAGYKCPTTSAADRAICPSGTYSYEGATECTDCPDGFYCPDAGTSAPSKCSAGTYSADDRLSCKDCEETYACPNGFSGARYECPSERMSGAKATKCEVIPDNSYCTTKKPSDVVTCGPRQHLVNNNCVDATAGHYYVDAYTVPPECPKGWFAAAGETECTICPAGSVCPNTDGTGDYTCSAGTYSEIGTYTECTQCPKGRYCPYTDVPLQKECDAGYYAPNQNMIACIPCPLNHECMNKIDANECPSNYYSLVGWGVCRPCPAGQSCSPSSAPQDCGAGKYSIEYDASCHLCPKGYYCPLDRNSQPNMCLAGTATNSLGSSACAPCASGEYSRPGAFVCSTCPAGYYCPDAARPPIICPLGTYSTPQATTCSDCDDGYVCLPGSTSPNPVNDKCPKGYYCKHGIVDSVTILQIIPCPAGKYGVIDGGGDEATACDACPVGYYCPLKGMVSPISCTKGSVCETTGLTAPNPCAEGKYNPSVGGSQTADCLDCPAGNYCPAGSYEPRPCPPGFVCPTGSAVFTDKCPAGTYSVLKPSGSADECIVCPVGTYCELGAMSPTYCPPGKYNEFTGKSSIDDCFNCTAGTACPKYGNRKADNDIPCPPGYYCPEGTSYPTQYPCPNGTYSNDIKLTSDTQCTACPKGYACLNGTNRYNNQMIKCAPGHYCPEGTVLPTDNPCTGGYYQPYAGVGDISACTFFKCPPGYYCPPGSSKPAGLCVDGYYCPEGSSSNTSFPCPAGTYSTGSGLKAATECTTCPAGYYCLEGSTTETITKCPAGTYNDLYGKAAPTDCKACEEGYYCPTEGSTAMLECGLTKYSGPSAASCTICPAGYYCDTRITKESEITSNAKICKAGFLCPEGTGEFPLDSLRCPKGRYCLEGNVYPKTCPPGTYNPHRGAKSEADCLLVPAGYYSSRAADKPEGDCAPGYYCPLGSARAQMFPCPAKTFRSRPNGESLADCGPCPAGYYCLIATVDPIPCPVGYYCLPGTDTPIKCPKGYFGASPMLSSLDQCTECWSGRYCSQDGLTYPDGKCDPGYYCKARAIVPNPVDDITGNLCPKGAMCPQGSAAGQPCSAGKYSNAKGLTSDSDCSSCPAGSYCVGEVKAGVTGTCDEGYYCPSGSSSSKEHAASPGYYSPGSTGAQSICSAGQYTANSASSKCTSCPASYYCSGSGNTGIFTDCTKGHYCPLGTGSPKNCPAGTYNPVYGLKASSECLDCPAGYACPYLGRSSPYYSCKYRYYCPLRSTSRYQRYCITGHYCPTGTGRPIPCPIGTYTPHTGRYALSHCYSCTAGKYCEKVGLASPTGSCHEGYYCPAGQSVPRPTNYYCDVGQYCPAGSSSPRTCPAGTFQNSKKQGACITCPKGYFCEAGSVTFTSNQDCPPGYYCPAGTRYSTEHPCPAGTYNPNSNAFSQSQCIPCEPGYYCSGQARTAMDYNLKCAPGYYCIRGASTSSPTDGTTGYLCTGGTYCPGGTSYPLPCTPGSYCSGNYRTAPTGPCPAGRYCPLGASTYYRCPTGSYCPYGSPAPIPCPAGTYRNSYYRSSLSECTACPNGYYCANPGQTSYTGQCYAGYYCNKDATMTTGFTTPRPNNRICPKGYYCPTGTDDKKPCPSSQYQDVEGQASCKPCPAGYECQADSKTLCKPNLEKPSFYCPVNNRAKVPCGDGKFSTQIGASTSSDCHPCPPGHYCPLTPSATEEKINKCPAGRYCPSGSGSSKGYKCPVRHYCPEGSAEAFDCPPGYYCPSEEIQEPTLKCNAGYYCIKAAISATETNSAYGIRCPTGHYCPEGTPEPIPCPPGTYRNDQGGVAVGSCYACFEGYYCPRRGSTTYSNGCPAGYYCPSGTGKLAQYPCEPGYMCPPGSPDHVLCPDNYYQPLPVQASCLPCPARFYCQNANAVDAQTPKICPAGSYCPGEHLPIPCSAGTYNPREGMRYSSECDTCPAGKICNTDGLAAPAKDCTAGYYCTRGVSQDPPPNDSTGGECPRGHYCPEGSPGPVPCPPGTYNDLSRKSLLSDCLPCPASYFCPYRGGYSELYKINVDNTFKCYAGYLCISGSVSPTPNDGTKGRKCAAGKYCDFGATVENDCVEGTYNPYEGQSSCLPCPPGRLCPTPGLTAYTTCPLGSYCPGGTSVPSLCPPGTYSPNINLISSDECYKCDPGKYCLGGSGVPTGPCSEGYVCARGSASPHSAMLYSPGVNAEGLCPPGSYCLAGSKAPTPCPVGTYQDEYGMTTCKPCPANYYCPMTGMTTYYHHPCAEGYVCTGSATTATPLDLTEGGRPCDEGHYCVLGPVGGIVVELPCPAGTYEPRKGSKQCQECPAGFYCPEGSVAPVPCIAGYYCEAHSSVPTKCPDGTYSNVQGLQNVDQCRPCPAGEYCHDGARKGTCDAGYYCISGAKIPNDPDMLCPPGAYCLTGSTRPTICPVGKVRLLPGGTSESDCTSCSVGYYCIPGSPTPMPCPKGHYCPIQTPIPIPCPRGTYQSQELKTSINDCVPCPPGYYCAEEGLAYLEAVKCPPGHFCNVSSALPHPCPPGTYLDESGGYKVGHCKKCPEGFSCDEGTITPNICKEGTYCPEGSVISVDCPAKYFCRYAMLNGRTIPKRQPCPGAYYCPLNTIDPIKCENGYYCPPMSDAPIPCPSGTTGTNNIFNDDITTGCTVCQPGTYSSSSGGTSKCLPCAAGYVCLLGATTATPVDKQIDKGYECPKGYYCPEGTYEPTACPTGTFNNKLKGTTVSSCMPCESGTYNNLEGQTGCRACGPSSTSDRGSETCKCYGKNRVFHMSTGKCICKQFYTSVKYGDTEDSKKDCRPILMERCSNGYLRDTFGKCVSPDDCTKECKGKKGKRTPGIGICECSEISDPDTFCNATCRARMPVLTVTQSGQIKTMSSVYNGTDSIKLSTKIMGEPKCPAGGCKVISVNMETAGGFSADYQPSPRLKTAIANSSRLLLANKGKARRFLESTSSGKVENPAICIKLGDSVTFDIPSAEHYPVYLKDAMANSNPNFDYSAFMSLENKIKSGETPEMFIFTFNQPGVYVFADNADRNQMSIFSVMGKTEQCPSTDKNIMPITAESLTKMGVKQNEEITLSPDWIFIGCCFIIVLILIPGVVVCISYLYNSGKKTQKNLAAISFAKKQPIPLSTDRVGLLNTNARNSNLMDATEDQLNKHSRTMLDLKAKDEENEVDPGIFDEIYQQLKDHAQYVKEEFEKKTEIDKENIGKVWDSMKGLRKMIKQKLKDIAKIFGKNIKYLLSEKKKPGGQKAKQLEEIELNPEIEEHKSEEGDSEETEGENDIDRIIEAIEAKNGEDLKELAKMQEQEDEKLREFMQKYVEDQNHRLEAFKEKVLENASISESDKQELLRQYENQLQDLQKELIISQKEQQQQLKLRLEARKNHRGQLAAQLDKLNSQRKDLTRLIDNQLLDVKMKVKAEEKRINESAAAERTSIEENVEMRKAEALKKQRALLDKKIKKTSDPRKRTEILEQFEKDTKEIEKIFSEEKQKTLEGLLQNLTARVSSQLAELHENANQEIATLKEQRKSQLERIRDVELIILNKLGNVAIDEKIAEAIEADRMKAREDENNFESAKEEYQRKLEDASITEKARINKIRDEFIKDEDMIKEDYEVQKRIITNAIKKKSEDLQKQKEKYMKEIKEGLLTDEEENSLKAKIKALDDQLARRIGEEVSKQEQTFQQKLREKRKLKAQHEADVKETQANLKSRVEKEWLEKEQALRTQIRKDRLSRLLEELKARTKGEELPIAVESVIESIHMEELTDLLGKQYREKAYALSESIGDLIQNKLIEINKVKEEMEQHFQKLKESLEKRQISHSDYERRLRDIQSRENDRLRDIELQYIQKQNDMERALCGNLAEKQEQELIQLREEQWKEKRKIISEIALFVSGSNSGMQMHIQSILGGGDVDKGVREVDEYKEQLRQLREKRLAELDERRMRLQSIAIENEEAIKRFNEGTKQMLDQLSRREREREEKRKADIERLKKEQETKLKLQEGITEADKQKIMEEYNEALEKLTAQMDAEHKRQANKMMEKLEKRLKEKDRVKAQKQIQLATYKKEVSERMEQQIKENQIKIDTKVEVKDIKAKVSALVEKYDAEKVIFDKKKRLEGVENIDELAQIDDMAELREKEPEDEIGGILANIDFDGLYEKIGMMEERVGLFTEEQFHKIIEGFRVINSTLNELKEKALARNKKFQFQHYINSNNLLYQFMLQYMQQC
eukprot:TRINITY_DN199_c1_g1_i1.p1 TRINITY_DN199_c1_g1~~TRINITY_DN199_c1_g1_i1.p1  ORF type:complete len:4309 (-),score=431.50 TRINITY_DN199_c1_g1_i1:34-12960(-)